MNNCTGIWLDHTVAYILRPSDLGCDTLTVESGIDRKHRSTGGKAKSRPYMHENGASSSSHFDQQHKNTLHKYYLEVESQLGKTEDLLILGPGMAKHEFRSVLLSKEEYKATHIEMATEQQITDSQLRARVMTYFGRPPMRRNREVPGQPPVANEKKELVNRERIDGALSTAASD